MVGKLKCFKCGEDIPDGSRYCNNCGFRLARTGRRHIDPNRLIIPRNEITEGIKKMLLNAEQFLKDAKVLLQKGSIDHALGLVTLAAEEGGKALLLIDEARQTYPKNFIVIQKLEEQRLKVGDPFMRIVDGDKLIIDPYGAYSRYEQVAPNPFYSHRSKLEKISLIILYSEIREWMRKGNQASFQQDSVNRVKLVKAGEFYRDAAFHVGFNQNKKEWSFGCGANKTEVKKLINDVGKAIKHIRKQARKG